MKQLFISLTFFLFISSCCSQNMCDEKNDLLSRIVDNYISITGLQDNNSKRYFCIGISEQKEDTLIYISGGYLENYWSQLSEDGEYHEISPTLLYRRINNDVITIYPDKSLEEWAIKNLNCHSTDLTRLHKGTNGMFYDPVEVTYRIKKDIEIEFIHWGFTDTPENPNDSSIQSFCNPLFDEENENK